MRIAIFSDVHSNLPPLEIVLGDSERPVADERYAVGDLVGTRPGPTNSSSETVEFRRVESDVEAAGTAIESTGLPAEFADQLREARGYRA